jgi:hypothetical protein
VRGLGCLEGQHVLRLIVQAAKVISLLDIMLQLRITPTLIGRCPRHDTRVIHVALDHLHPFLVEAFDVFFAEVVGIGHFAPNQEAESISPVHKDGVFDLQDL